jgi:hypothetical protein
MRQCRHCRGFSAGRDRPARCIADIRIERRDHAYAIGHISGCHLNPAVTVGLTAGGRFPGGQVLPYVIAQVIGAVAAAALLDVIASGAPGFDLSKALLPTATARTGIVEGRESA